MMHERNQHLTGDSNGFDICSKMVSLDKAILFCAIAEKPGYLVTIASNPSDGSSGRSRRGSNISPSTNMDNKGNGQKFQNELGSYLSDSDMEKYVFNTGIMYGIHKSWEHKLGRVRYFVSHYEDMEIATIMLGKGQFILLGIESKRQRRIDRILSQKIMPYLESSAVSMK
ncbi:MAG: hypothetical protein ACREAW_07250 [Nitrososphaera sp.]